MNLRQLEYFVSVAETLSFTRTAEKFYISQTAVTQQIKTLENNIGVKLLRRTKRHVELTPAGNVFLSEAKAILNRTQDAIKKAQKAATGFTGNLNLGIVEGYDNPDLPEILRSFKSGYPNVSLSIVEADTSTLYTRLLDNTLDVVLNVLFAYSNLEEKEILYKEINKYNLIVLLPTSHPLAYRSVLKLSDLKNDSFILTAMGDPEDSFGQYESTMAHFIRSGFTPNIVQQTSKFDTTALMVAANMGVAIVPSYALSSSRNTRSLVKIPLDEDTEKFEIVAARYKENQNPTIEKFLSYI
ncbi:LysR family transcriptional regulator [Blautia liquoris]|uniref:LysR family transcriptional regulator n=1 Tax=Blautia liquoris TaxID=2779518 RepID=A0A7M2RDJ7_9FIRM|nr:LysR substrate-binding domain-containing protein [Blautia liquoris]QOV18366.1 LysR family transcriptional regulator [Blautia liquoris]